MEHLLMKNSKALKKSHYLNLLSYVRSVIVVLVALVTLSFTGCPDYSHLRPVPDYKNMTDGGAESEAAPQKRE